MKNIFKWRQERAKNRAADAVIDRLYPADMQPRNRELLRLAIRSMDPTDYFFPTSKPHKPHLSDVQEAEKQIGETLRTIETSVGNLAVLTAQLWQSRDEFPDQFQTFPDEDQQNVDALVDSTQVDRRDPAFLRYQRYIADLHAPETE